MVRFFILLLFHNVSINDAFNVHSVFDDTVDTLERSAVGFMPAFTVSASGQTRDDGYGVSTRTSSPENEKSCAPLVSQIRCDAPFLSTCADVVGLQLGVQPLCPAACPIVKPSTFLPCQSRCVSEDQCDSPSFRAEKEPDDVLGYVSVANVCIPCEVIGCRRCVKNDPHKCEACKTPIFALDEEGSCVYKLSSVGPVRWFVVLILVLVCLLLPHELVKLFRPRGRPAVLKAAQNHSSRCRSLVLRDEEVSETEAAPGRGDEGEESGGGRPRFVPPSFLKTNIHREYVSGVGLALYYNWIVFLGIWAVICAGIAFWGLNGLDYALTK